MWNGAWWVKSECDPAPTCGLSLSVVSTQSNPIWVFPHPPNILKATHKSSTIINLFFFFFLWKKWKLIFNLSPFLTSNKIILLKEIRGVYGPNPGPTWKIAHFYGVGLLTDHCKNRPILPLRVWTLYPGM